VEFEMLSGRKCKVRNPHFDKPDCPSGFEHLEIFDGLIACEPDLKQIEDGYDYAVLIITGEGKLFATSCKNITLIDYTLPPF
jgi:hypothetical protein